MILPTKINPLPLNAAIRAKLVRKVATRNYVVKCCGKSRCVDGSKRNNKTYQVGHAEVPLDAIGRAHLKSRATINPGGIPTEVRMVVIKKSKYIIKFVHMRL
jgi:hypothetical protein